MMNHLPQQLARPLRNLAFLLPLLLLPATAAQAQFVGYGGYGNGYPGYGYGNGYPGYAYGGYGSPGYGYGYPNYAYGGYGPPGLGYGGYGPPGLGYGGYGPPGLGYGGYGFGADNSMFGVGLTPLGVQSALFERNFLGRGVLPSPRR